MTTSAPASNPVATSTQDPAAAKVATKSAAVVAIARARPAGSDSSVSGRPTVKPMMPTAGDQSERSRTSHTNANRIVPDTVDTMSWAIQNDRKPGRARTSTIGLREAGSVAVELGHAGSFRVRASTALLAVHRVFTRTLATTCSLQPFPPQCLVALVPFGRDPPQPAVAPGADRRRAPGSVARHPRRRSGAAPGRRPRPGRGRRAGPTARLRHGRRRRQPRQQPRRPCSSPSRRWRLTGTRSGPCCWASPSVRRCWGRRRALHVAVAGHHAAARRTRATRGGTSPPRHASGSPPSLSPPASIALLSLVW